MNVHRNVLSTSAVIGLALSAVVAMPIVLTTTATGVAQSAASLPHVVGFVSPQSREAQALQIKAFLRGMEEAGYIDGQNVRYEWRFGDGNPDRNSTIVEEMVALAPEVIVTPPGLRTFVAQATSTIPVVVANMGQNQLTEVKALPNANMTGTASLPGAPGNPERFQLAAELVGGGDARIGYLLYTGGADGGAADRANAEAAAQAAGVTIVLGDAPSVDGIAAGAEALSAQDVDAIIYVSGGGIFSTGRSQMIDVATKEGVPTVYGSVASVVAGGLISLGANPELTFHEAADLVDQILKGAAPSDIPFVELETAWLAVSLDAAEAIGFNIPDSILARANEVLDE